MEGPPKIKFIEKFFKSISILIEGPWVNFHLRGSPWIIIDFWSLSKSVTSWYQCSFLSIVFFDLYTLKYLCWYILHCCLNDVHKRFDICSTQLSFYIVPKVIIIVIIFFVINIVICVIINFHSSITCFASCGFLLPVCHDTSARAVLVFRAAYSC